MEEQESEVETMGVEEAVLINFQLDICSNAFSLERKRWVRIDKSLCKPCIVFLFFIFTHPFSLGFGEDVGFQRKSYAFRLGCLQQILTIESLNICFLLSNIKVYLSTLSIGQSYIF